MSGVMSRFRAIFSARANEAADYMEDPRSSLEFSLRKLEDNRRELSRSLVEVSAAKQRLDMQRSRLAYDLERYQDQAGASLKAGREDLARGVLERKQDAQERLTRLDADLESLDQQVQNLKQNQVKLDRKIALFRDKKEELKSIYDSSRAQLRVREALSGISEDLADVGNTIRRIEERIHGMRSRNEAIHQLISEGVLYEVLEEGSDIDRQLSEMSRNQLVEEELAQLKATAPAK